MQQKLKEIFDVFFKSIPSVSVDVELLNRSINRKEKVKFKVTFDVLTLNNILKGETYRLLDVNKVQPYRRNSKQADGNHLDCCESILSQRETVMQSIVDSMDKCKFDYDEKGRSIGVGQMEKQKAYDLAVSIVRKRAHIPAMKVMQVCLSEALK